MKKIYMLACSLLFCVNLSAQVTASVEVIVYGNPVNANECNSTGYYINGQVIEYCACGALPSIHIAIIDSACSPNTTCNNNFGQANIFSDPDGDCITDVNTITTCRARPERYFIFRSADATSMQSMAALLDGIQAGNYIIAYSMFPSQFSTMDTSFSNVFSRLGSAIIPSLADDLPFIFFCKKGDTGSVQEVVGTMPNDLITLQVTVQCGSTGVTEEEKLPVDIFPNPVTDHLRIELSNASGGWVDLTDAVGNVVLSQELSRASGIFDLKNLSSGMYILTVSSGDRRYYRKFVKQ